MRNLLIIGAAIASLAAMTTVPATAGTNIATYKYVQRHYPIFCILPAQLENVCVAWGPAGPGQLFGPCIKSQIECVTPPNIQ